MKDKFKIQNEALPESSKKLKFPEIGEGVEEIKEFKTDINTDTQSVTAEKIAQSRLKQAPKRKRRSQNLALRMDVMNKNFFRAFKRECKADFISYNNAKKCKNFQECLERYSGHLLQLAEAEGLEGQLVDRVAFAYYLGILLNYCHMKKSIRTQSEQEKLDFTFSVIYSYSHKKFYDFIRTPEIKLLIKVILQKIGVSSFVARHRMSKNKENYEPHINGLLDKL